MGSRQKENSWQSVIRRLVANDKLESCTRIFVISLQLLLYTVSGLLYTVL